MESGIFNFPGRKKLLQPESAIEVIVVDTTETPIQRPKHRPQRYYSGKKTAYGAVSGCDRQKDRTNYLGSIQWKAHDGTVFKRTMRVNPAILVLTDSGTEESGRFTQIPCCRFGIRKI